MKERRNRQLPRIRPLLLHFLRLSTNSGFILFAAALLGFLAANSPWREGYLAVREVPIAVQVGEWRLSEPLVGWVNDLLMSLFFLMVGLEIKRELTQGELRDPRRSALAVGAAVGGMILPALVYLGFTWSQPAARGWAIPMATDIAFALAVLSLLGPRVPLALKVFLTALAVVDDLGAVLVIALFYTSTLDIHALLWAAAAWLLAILAGRLAVRSLTLYAVLGLAIWYFMLQSGVDPAIAGVLLALAIPAAHRAVHTRDPLGRHSDLHSVPAREPAANGSRSQVEAATPLHRLEYLVTPWASYLALPLFAFFNAGVQLTTAQFGAATLGASAGLMLGKPLGILAGSWMMLRSGLATMPNGTGWREIAGVGLLGGIGFTVSLFVAELAFAGTPLLDQAKLGVLGASLLSGLSGLLLLYRTR